MDSIRFSRVMFGLMVVLYEENGRNERKQHGMG